MSPGAIVALVAGAVVLVGVLIAGVVFGVNFVRAQLGLGDSRLELSADALTPHNPDVFLDDRYAAGFTEFELDAYAKVLGFTTDRSKIVTLKQTDAARGLYEWSRIDIATQEIEYTQPVEHCSNVSPDNTLFCTALVIRDDQPARMFAEVSIDTGEPLVLWEIGGSRATEIQYLGTNANGDDLISLYAHDGLGAPSEQWLYAVPGQGESFTWETQLATENGLPETCGVFDGGSALACFQSNVNSGGALDSGTGETDFDDFMKQLEDAMEGGDLDGLSLPSSALDGVVMSFDPLTGDVVATVDVENAPVFAEDGFKVEAVSEEFGVSISGSSETLDSTSYSYRGEVLSEDVDGAYSGISLVPAYHPASMLESATYTLEVLNHGSAMNQYVVDATGLVVLQSEYEWNRPIGTDAPFIDPESGETIWTGNVLGVTGDGSTILATEGYASLEVALVNITTGEAMALPFDEFSLTVSNGIIFGRPDAMRTVVLIPNG